MPNAVYAVPAADAPRARAWFAERFEFETDCWDVHDAVSNGRQDFLLVDVRSPDLYANGHALGAVNIPHRKLIESLLGRYSRETMFVVYCAGPHCNGAHRAAVRLARLGRPVKIMIGGMTGWLDEGFRTESGAAAFAALSG